MRGITIIYNNQEVHTGDDLDLVQEVKKIEKPKVQTYTVEVPGRNGLLNLTKGITGKVMYYNRSLSFQYFGTGDRESLLALDAYISRFHGETIRIIDDDYPDYYYEGEANVETIFSPSGNYITIKLTVDAQPFRLKRDLTVYYREINGDYTLYLDNESIDVVPVITVTGEITIEYEDISVTLNKGTYTIDSIELHAGLNLIKISGIGTVSIEYREGAI